MHTVIYPIMSYSLSEVASNHLNEKTANDTLSQEGGRAAPGTRVQWLSADWHTQWTPLKRRPCKGLWGYKEPWLRQEGAGGGDCGTLVCALLCHHKKYLSSIGNCFKQKENLDKDFIVQIVKCTVIWGTRSLFIQKA